MDKRNIHNLKIKEKYFNDVLYKRKKFELRKDDRDYKEGDLLRLKEIGSDGTYTGREVIMKVTYILKDCEEYGLKKGYCILGLGNVKFKF